MITYRKCQKPSYTSFCEPVTVLYKKTIHEIYLPKIVLYDLDPHYYENVYSSKWIKENYTIYLDEHMESFQALKNFLSDIMSNIVHAILYIDTIETIKYYNICDRYNHELAYKLAFSPNMYNDICVYGTHSLIERLKKYMCTHYITYEELLSIYPEYREFFYNKLRVDSDITYKVEHLSKFEIVHLLKVYRGLNYRHTQTVNIKFKKKDKYFDPLIHDTCMFTIVNTFSTYIHYYIDGEKVKERLV